jgi:hypothetical protein
LATTNTFSRAKRRRLKKAMDCLTKALPHSKMSL